MADQRVQRRLAAILAADVVGYTRLMGADEAGTLNRLKALRRELFEPTTRQYGGRIFKTTGDGALAEFQSAADAVSCAVDIQQALSRREAEETEERRIELRIGISLGDVMVDGGDLYGNGVNVAARMEGVAEPGGVCISGNVHEHVRGAPDLAFDDLGPQEVKNIAEPVHCYRVRSDQGGSAEQPGAAPGGRAERPRVAVLPFQNMSNDPDQEYFADGMAEEIITGLSRIRWLGVVARNSSFVYKGRTVDIREVGRELGVRYVLEGSVRKAGNRLRITAQLIEAETGDHLWAERYDGAIEDVFDFQDRITASVTAEIVPSLRDAELERARRKRPESLDAYDLVLRAFGYIWAFTPKDRTVALDLLTRALEIDPDYAEAHALAAWCHEQRYTHEEGDAAAQEKESAIRHARAARRGDLESISHLNVVGMVTAQLEGDARAALTVAERMIALNPHSAETWAQSAAINALVGRFDVALEHARRAQAYPESRLGLARFASDGAIAAAAFHFGDYEEAAAASSRRLDANPRPMGAHLMLIASLTRLGRSDEAAAATTRLFEFHPDFRIADYADRLLFEPEQRKDVVAALREAGLPE